MDRVFEGNDWTELLAPLGFDVVVAARPGDFADAYQAWEDGARDVLLGAFSLAMTRSQDGDDTDADRVAAVLRPFLAALANAEEGIGEPAVWRAMASIESSYTLLQYAERLLTLMWS